MPSALTASIPNLRSLTKLRFRSGQISKKRPERGVRDVFIPSLLLGIHGAHLAILAHALELDLAVDQREQGIVLADADVVARMDMRASLANENVAGEHELPVCALGAEALGLGITAVLGGAAAFLMREELETPKLRYDQDIRPADCTASASCR